jgi:hypothetical protein
MVESQMDICSLILKRNWVKVFWFSNKTMYIIRAHNINIKSFNNSLKSQQSFNKIRANKVTHAVQEWIYVKKSYKMYLYLHGNQSLNNQIHYAQHHKILILLLHLM